LTFPAVGSPPPIGVQGKFDGAGSLDREDSNLEHAIQIPGKLFIMPPTDNRIMPDERSVPIMSLYHYPWFVYAVPILFLIYQYMHASAEIHKTISKLKRYESNSRNRSKGFVAVAL